MVVSEVPKHSDTKHTHTHRHIEVLDVCKTVVFSLEPDVNQVVRVEETVEHHQGYRSTVVGGAAKLVLLAGVAGHMARLDGVGQ